MLSVCCKCQKTCSKILRIDENPKLLIFKFLNERDEDVYNFENVIERSFCIKQVFDSKTDAKYELLMILIRVNESFKYFYVENDRFYLFNQEYFSYSQMFQKIAMNKMVVVGAIYELSLNNQAGSVNFTQSLNSKAAKLLENYCKCGKKCITGEICCETCVLKEKTHKNQEIRSSEVVHKDSKKCSCKSSNFSVAKCKFCQDSQEKLPKKQSSFEEKKKTDSLYQSFNEKYNHSIQIKSIKS